MKCLQCKEDFETDNPRRKFCSGKCKIAYHRLHKNKSEVTKVDLKVLYNEILSLVQSIGNNQKLILEPTHLFVPKNEHISVTSVEKPKIEPSPTDDKYTYHETKIIACKDGEQLNSVLVEMKADTLPFFTRRNLQSVADKVGANFYHD